MAWHPRYGAADAPRGHSRHLLCWAGRLLDFAWVSTSFTLISGKLFPVLHCLWNTHLGLAIRVRAEPKDVKVQVQMLPRDIQLPKLAGAALRALPTFI